MKTIGSLLVLFLLLVLPGCKAVVNKLAFHPNSTDVLTADELPKGVEELVVSTEDGKQLVLLHLPSNQSDQLVIYFHGNAGNIYHRLSALLRLRALGVSVIGVSYRGYGKSGGSPSEKGLYLDGAAAFEHAVNRLGFLEENIMLFGRSIGTTVAVDLAQEKDLKGVLLATPLTSGKDMAKVMGFGWMSFLASNPFDNLSKIESLNAPLLVVHGTSDDVTPFVMGEELFARANVKKEFVAIDGGNHNNLHDEFEQEYWAAITKFILNPGLDS